MTARKAPRDAVPCLNCEAPFAPTPDNDVLCPRCFERAQAVEEFRAEHSDDVFAEWCPYHAPWAERFADGSLSPIYGPRTPAAYEAEKRRFDDEEFGGIGSGALWDPAEEAKQGTRRAILRQAKRRVRDHAEAVVRWLERHGHELSARHAAVGVAVFKDGLGARRAAKRVGMHWRAVEQVVRELRERAQGRRAS